MSRDARAQLAAAVFLVVLVFVAFFGAYSGRRFARIDQTVAAQQPITNHLPSREPLPQSFWEKLFDPVAIFTAILGVSTIGLWLATKRSAAIAERALTDVERPWVFRDIVTVTVRHRPGVKFNDWMVKLKWRNVGRTPALLVDLQFKIEDLANLPAQPDYSNASPLGVVTALAQSWLPPARVALGGILRRSMSLPAPEAHQESCTTVPHAAGPGTGYRCARPLTQCPGQAMVWSHLSASSPAVRWPRAGELRNALVAGPSDRRACLARFRRRRSCRDGARAARPQSRR